MPPIFEGSRKIDRIEQLPPGKLPTDECAICLSSFQSIIGNGDLRVLACGCVFCVGCMDLIGERERCPTCNVNPMLSRAAREPNVPRPGGSANTYPLQELLSTPPLWALVRRIPGLEAPVNPGLQEPGVAIPRTTTKYYEARRTQGREPLVNVSLEGNRWVTAKLVGGLWIDDDDGVASLATLFTRRRKGFWSKLFVVLPSALPPPGPSANANTRILWRPSRLVAIMQLLPSMVGSATPQSTQNGWPE